MVAKNQVSVLKEPHFLSWLYGIIAVRPWAYYLMFPELQFLIRELYCLTGLFNKHSLNMLCNSG